MIFITKQFKSGEGTWQDAWQEFLKLGDGKTLHEFRRENCRISTAHKRTSKGLEEAIKIEFDVSEKPTKTIARDDFRKMFSSTKKIRIKAQTAK